MKIFISHKDQDSLSARSIAHRLKALHGLDSYLDVIDPYIGRPIEELAEHIREQLGRCTQLLAVVSSATASSQWVPWEIGVATEKDFPLATYSVDKSVPPEFLRKWPYLRSDSDLDAYARASKSARNVYVAKRMVLNESLAKTASTKNFYTGLRRELGQ